MSAAKVWTLVDLEWAGRVFRLAEGELVIDSDDGELEYLGVVSEVRFSTAAELFGGWETAPDIVVRCVLPVDVAELVAAGHPLGGAVCSISRWREGTTWEQRREVLEATVSLPDYGADGEEVAFKVSAGLWKNTNAFPPADAQVDGRTWEEDRLGDEDIGVVYPWIIGYPGKDPEAADGWITGAQGVWCDKERYWQKLVIAGHPIEAETVMINNDADSAGVEVNVSRVKDLLGRTITIVDYGAEEYGGPQGTDGSALPANYLGADYCPLVDEQVSIFVGFHAGGGLLGLDGQVLRRAGDVLEWALGRTSLPVDYGRCAAAKPALAGFLIDGVVDEREDEWDKWIQNALVPLLPVSIVSSSRGYYPMVWKWDATARDATFRINVDRDKRIERNGAIRVNNGTIRNEFELKFGASLRTQTFLRTARLGVFDQEYASTVLRGGGSDRVLVEATVPGAKGEGIELFTTSPPTGLAVLQDTAAKTIEINFAPGGTDTQTIIDEINTNASITLVRARLIDGDGTGIWNATLAKQEQTTTTALRRTKGQSGSLACARSQAAYRLPDGSPGVYPYSVETYYYYDRASADRTLQWWAAAWAFEQREADYFLPEEDWMELERGQIGLLTDSELHLEDRVVIVGRVDVDGSGVLGVTFHLLTDPAREIA